MVSIGAIKEKIRKQVSPTREEKIEKMEEQTEKAIKEAELLEAEVELARLKSEMQELRTEKESLRGSSTTGRIVEGFQSFADFAAEASENMSRNTGDDYEERPRYRKRQRVQERQKLKAFGVDW